MTTRIIGAAAAIAVLAAVPGAQSAGRTDAGRTLEADFEVRWLGLAVYSGKTIATINSTAYSMKSEGRSRGILNLFSRSKMDSDVTGKFKSARFRPIAYTSRSRWNQKNRFVRIQYSRDGRVLTKVMPQEHMGKRKPVSQKLRKAAYDPATAFLAAITTSLNSSPCRLSLPIFDGRRRFDIRLEFVEKVRLDKLIKGVGTTEAIRCRLRMHRIAGFTAKHLKKHAAPLPAADLIIARITKAKVWFPVRFTVDSSWGPVTSNLLRLKVNGRVTN